MCTFVYVLVCCVLFYLCLLCSRKANFYLFIDNKDSVFCMQISVMLVGECVHNLGDGCCVKSLMWGYVQL